MDPSRTVLLINFHPCEEKLNVCPDSHASLTRRVQTDPSRIVLLIAFRPREENVYPDGHGLGAGGHQEVGALESLHAEGQLGVGALDGAQVIHVHLLHGLETHHALQLALRLVREVHHLSTGKNAAVSSGRSGRGG